MVNNFKVTSYNTKCYIFIMQQNILIVNQIFTNLQPYLTDICLSLFHQMSEKKHPELSSNQTNNIPSTLVRWPLPPVLARMQVINTTSPFHWRLPL